MHYGICYITCHEKNIAVNEVCNISKHAFGKSMYILPF
jgi:hypothetical protein